MVMSYFKPLCLISFVSSTLKFKTCGLYYKHVMIVNDDSSIVSWLSFKLIDNPRVVIYDRHRFIILALGAKMHFRRKN
jgi:hypothetical protein